MCGVCYYPKLLQMQHFHPNPRPRLVITNSADNTYYYPSMAPYGNKNHVKWYWKLDYTAFENTFHGYALHEVLFCVSPYTILSNLISNTISPNTPHLYTAYSINIHSNIGVFLYILIFNVYIWPFSYKINEYYNRIIIQNRPRVEGV